MGGGPEIVVFMNFIPALFKSRSTNLFHFDMQSLYIPQFCFHHVDLFVQY